MEIDSKAIFPFCAQKEYPRTLVELPVDCLHTDQPDNRPTDRTDRIIHRTTADLAGVSVESSTPLGLGCLVPSSVKTRSECPCS